MKLELPRIYPITDTRISGLSHSEQVERLIDGGADLVQLREKHATAREFYLDAAEALRIARRRGAKLIINDRVDVASALDADGVHLGQSDMPVEAARRLLGSEAIIGFSTHNAAQAKDAVHLPIDYVAFGPVYGTTTKNNPDPVAGLNTLVEIKSIVGALPLVAIGGITLATAGEVLNLGADAAAVISALLANPTKIAENLRNMRTAIEEHVRKQHR